MSAGARAVALEVVRRVVERGAYSNLTLDATLRRTELPQRDRALAAELSYGTLRRLRSLDWAIANRADRPVDRITARALAILRLGAYQLLFTRIPPHAAVGETVGLASPRERGFVNAVLRALAAAPPPWPEGPDPEAVEVRTGLAAWAVRELASVLGSDAEPAATALGSRAPISLRANRSRVTADELARALRAAGHAPGRGRVHPDALAVEAVVPSELPGFAAGDFAIQDEASMLVAQALEPRPGDRVLDVCAGPGGKATHVASLVEPNGLVVAADLAPKRAQLVVRTARRLGVRVPTIAQDARRPAVRGPFDRVLVDAPCTGIGSARRRPELLWRPTAGDARRLSALQLEIAASAADLVRPGGRLVYSVCTFPRDETDGVCEALLRVRPDLEEAAVDGPDGREERLRLWPHRHGTDAMFVAAFRRHVSR